MERIKSPESVRDRVFDRLVEPKKGLCDAALDAASCLGGFGIRCMYSPDTTTLSISFGV